MNECLKSQYVFQSIKNKILPVSVFAVLVWWHLVSVFAIPRLLHFACPCAGPRVILPDDQWDGSIDNIDQSAASIPGDPEVAVVVGGGGVLLSVSRAEHGLYVVGNPRRDKAPGHGSRTSRRDIDVVWRGGTNASGANIDRSKRSERSEGSNGVSSVAADEVAAIWGWPDHISFSVESFNFIVNFKMTIVKNRW